MAGPTEKVAREPSTTAWASTTHPGVVPRLPGPGKVLVTTGESEMAWVDSATLGTGEVGLSDATPQSVSAVGDAGVSLDVSRADHVHAHGDQTGVTMHALATADLHGFMSAADKSALDTLTRSDATPGAVAAAGTPGVATTLARGDHVHAHGNQAGGSTHALATASVAGFLPAADKAKLDSLSPTAQAVIDTISAAEIFVTGLVPNATSSADKLANATALNAAFAAAAAKGTVRVTLPAFRINIGTNRLTLPPSKGVRIGGRGSAHYPIVGGSNHGTWIVYEGGGDESWDVVVRGTSTTSVSVGTGSKTWTTNSLGHFLVPGCKVVFTSTSSGATLTGVITSYLDLAVTVNVTAVTGAGTYTDWTFATAYDAAIITARSSGGLAVENMGIEYTNAAFRGVFLDLNGEVLASDTSNSRVHAVCFYGAAALLNVAACGVYMTAGFGLDVRYCKFSTMQIGCYLVGAWNHVDDLNEFSLVDYAAAVVWGAGVYAVVNSEYSTASNGGPNGGVKAVNCHDATIGTRLGDASPKGPVATAFNCVRTKFIGNYGVLATVGADACPIRIQGCQDTVVDGTFTFCSKLLDVSGALTNIGIVIVGTVPLTFAQIFHGSNYSNIDIYSSSEVNIVGLSGERRMSNVRHQNGCISDFGIICNGALNPVANGLNIGGGSRVTALAWGTNSGATIERLNSLHGYGTGIGYYPSQNDAAAGHSFLTRNSAATNGQDEQISIRASTGTTITRGAHVRRGVSVALATGANDNVDLSGSSRITLTASAACSIKGVTGGVDGDIKELSWTFGFPLTFEDETAGTSSRGIRTGVAGDIVFPPVASGGQHTVRLVYSGTRSRWEMQWPSTHIRSLNKNLGFSAALAPLTGETKTLTLTGAAVGDNVECNARTALPDGVVMNTWISAANTVSVKMYNSTAAPVDLSTIVLDVRVRT